VIEWVTVTAVLGATLVVLVDMVRAARAAISPGWDIDDEGHPDEADR